jgi:hypothetical protein
MGKCGCRFCKYLFLLMMDWFYSGENSTVII